MVTTELDLVILSEEMENNKENKKKYTKYKTA